MKKMLENQLETV